MAGGVGNSMGVFAYIFYRMHKKQAKKCLMFRPLLTEEAGDAVQGLGDCLIRGSEG